MITAHPTEAMISPARRLRCYWPILAYHSISDSRSDGLAISPCEFESHLRYFQRRGYKSATLQELLCELGREMPSPERRFVITFDDGYADNHEYALPLLRAFGYTATFFLITNSIGTDQIHSFDVRKPAQGLGPPAAFKSMTWSQVQDLAASGMQIGSHTCSHLVFDPDVPESALRDELINSRRTLEQETGVPIELFCYPRGKLDPRAIPILRSAGYRAAVFTPSLHDQVDETNYTLKRVGLYRSSMLQFRAKVTPAFFRLRMAGILRWR